MLDEASSRCYVIVTNDPINEILRLDKGTNRNSGSGPVSDKAVGTCSILCQTPTWISDLRTQSCTISALTWGKKT